MSIVRAQHERFNAVFESDEPSAMPVHYGRPETTARAVRNGAGVIEASFGIIAVSGEDRVEFVDNAVSNRVPVADGEGCYALLLDPQGKIRADLYVYSTSDRLLVFTPRDIVDEVASEWADRTFVQDVTIEAVTANLGVFGVHGPTATEKVASVLNATSTPDEHLSFVRGRIADEGVTVVRTDAPTGEEGYEVIVAADGAETVYDTLLSHGQNAVPFGTQVWNVLTLEAGTPLFEPELRGRIPNVVGVRNALDFEKGCYVGQEVVSRVENRGRPSRRLVGLRIDGWPEADAAVYDGGESIGELTRVVESPTLGATVALAVVEAGRRPEVVGDTQLEATPMTLPFVTGSDRSARIPAYPDPPGD